MSSNPSRGGERWRCLKSGRGIWQPHGTSIADGMSRGRDREAIPGMLSVACARSYPYGHMALKVSMPVRSTTEPSRRPLEGESCFIFIDHIAYTDDEPRRRPGADLLQHHQTETAAVLHEPPKPSVRLLVLGEET